MEPSCGGATCEVSMTSRETGDTGLPLDDESLLDFEKAAPDVPGCPRLWKCCTAPATSPTSGRSSRYQCIPPRIPKFFGGRGQSCREYSADWKHVKSDEKYCMHKAGSQWKKDQVMMLSVFDRMPTTEADAAASVPAPVGDDQFVRSPEKEVGSPAAGVHVAAGVRKLDVDSPETQVHVAARVRKLAAQLSVDLEEDSAAKAAITATAAAEVAAEAWEGVVTALERPEDSVYYQERMQRARAYHDRRIGTRDSDLHPDLNPDVPGSASPRSPSMSTSSPATRVSQAMRDAPPASGTVEEGTGPTLSEAAAAFGGLAPRKPTTKRSTPTRSRTDGQAWPKAWPLPSHVPEEVVSDAVSKYPEALPATGDGSTLKTSANPPAVPPLEELPRRPPPPGRPRKKQGRKRSLEPPSDPLPSHELTPETDPKRRMSRSSTQDSVSGRSPGRNSGRSPGRSPGRSSGRSSGRSPSPQKPVTPASASQPEYPAWPDLPPKGAVRVPAWTA